MVAEMIYKKLKEYNKMIKLPNNRENWNWHQWLTFKCNFACDYCIMGERQLGGGTPKYKPIKIVTGKLVDPEFNHFIVFL